MSHDEMIMALVAKRDKLEAENESMRRKLIMYKPQIAAQQTISYVLDRCVAERNELEVQLRDAKDIIQKLLTQVPFYRRR